MNNRIFKTLNNTFIILVFSLAIYIPFFVGIFEQSSIISNVEKRKLAKFPQTPNNLKEFIATPKSIDNYFSDHFGYREKLTNLYKLYKTKLGDSPSEDVTIGQDGWLFLGSDKNGYNKFGDPIGDYRNKNLYTPIQLNNITRYLKGQYNWLKKQGIEYVFFIAPNKHSIYSDKLPSYIKKINPESALSLIHI